MTSNSIISIDKVYFLNARTRRKDMVDIKDKQIYCPKSFSEQMAWIDEEVESIIKYDKEHNIRLKIQEKGIAAYGEAGYTHAIHRLFEIVRADPKNIALLHEVNRAEEDLVAYLYNKPDAPAEEEIFGYWNAYMQAYIAELEMHSIHYILYRIEKQSKKILGVYDSIAKLQDAYVIENQKLENRQKNIIGLLENNADDIVKPEKVMIDAFDEFTMSWHNNIKPENLFSRKYIDADEYKMAELEIDAPYMCMFKMNNLIKTLNGYVYDDSCSKEANRGKERLFVHFPVNYSYEILGLLKWYWGGWNSTPNSRDMQEKAREWYEKYDAELVKISHDTLTFNCRKLSDKEAKELIEDVEQLYALIIDCEPDELIGHLMNNETFTLWWD